MATAATGPRAPEPGPGWRCIGEPFCRPLEIKKTASPSRDDVRHFATLGRLKLPVGAGGIVCLAPEILPLTATAGAIPVAAL